MSNSKQFLKPLNQLNEDSNSIPLLEMPEMSKPFSVLNKPSSINSTWDRYIHSPLHGILLEMELPLSFKIDLQKDIVNMLEIMKNEYIKRLGYSNEYTVKAIKAYDDAKKVSDDYEKYF